MKKLCSIVLLSFVVVSTLVPALGVARAQEQPREVTLYSVQKHKDYQTASFSFSEGTKGFNRQQWDLCYGQLTIGDDLDWFSASQGADSRTLIKDLGLYNWNDSFVVSVVEPLPKLKDGETRQVVIDASGANGLPGKPGARGVSAGKNEREMSTSALISSNNEPMVGDFSPSIPRGPEVPPPPPQHREPVVSPIFLKAMVGHIYVIHVVDDTSDFYALFRVESLERGDHCTIAWKLIPPPQGNQ